MLSEAKVREILYQWINQETGVSDDVQKDVVALAKTCLTLRDMQEGLVKVEADNLRLMKALATVLSAIKTYCECRCPIADGDKERVWNCRLDGARSGALCALSKYRQGDYLRDIPARKKEQGDAERS